MDKTELSTNATTVTSSRTWSTVLQACPPPSLGEHWHTLWRSEHNTHVAHTQHVKLLLLCSGRLRTKREREMWWAGKED